MRKTLQSIKKRLRTKKEIISDFLTDLVKFKIIDLENTSFEDYLDNNFDDLMSLLLDKLYETEVLNGATV